ncbi:PPE domain-containing protein, partial [Umezawaea endophytica]
MGDHRWRGYTHEELHTMINGGPGVAASIPLEDSWKALSETLGQIDTSIQDGLTKVGASWEGASAEAATAALSPLAAWATDAGQGADTMKASAQLQGGYIADARKEMPEPVMVTTEAPSTGDKVLGALTGPVGMLHVINQQKDHEAQEAAQDNAEQKAITVMNNYQSSSEWNSDTLGEFVPPPQVVIDTPPPGGAGSYNSSSANYSSTDSSAYTPKGGDGTTSTSWAPPPSSPPPVSPPPVFTGGGGGGTTNPTWTPPPAQPPVNLPVQPTPPPPGTPPPGGFPPPGAGPVRPPFKGG